ncbi:hypothetical protein OG698_00195 [Streptomyces sp. NBC_01003]|uniref:hypothetical protein n=1 Tax=Streptomyces sp. NBC_01003 TaxID=2903714 RepID=UPI00386BB2E5|nr:hypothetical protein OG698_00195 [Streptomyces sp. NBC_01003]
MVQRLRFALVDGGVLPPRDARLADLERWIAEALGTVKAPAERRVIEGFATWYHLRRLREQAARKPVGAGQASVVRRQISAAIHLVNWLHQRGRALATATQRDVDDWLTEDHWLTQYSRTFVTWAVRNGHAHNINVPRRQPSDPEHFIEHDQRWDLVRRLMHDTDIPATQRLAGLLVLLFAQPVSRIASLSCQDVVPSDDGATLALGPVPLELPPPLDTLALELAQPRPQSGALGRASTQWLFPGRMPGRPISVGQLGRHMTALGIRVKPARNTALMTLAAELPAVVFSRLLGLHIDGATR